MSRRNRLLPRLGALAALLLWWAAARPALTVGFLADDYDVGALVAEHARAHPEAVDRVASLFTRSFGDRFEVWRPITLASIVADYARAGADGGAHHATNLVLWVLVAAAAGGVAAALARRGRPLADDDAPDAAGPRAFAFGAATALGAFAGVESLGWLVAREDLFVAACGLAAWRAQILRPDSVVRPAGWLVLAFLSKETAAVLPPALAWARLVDAAPRRGAADGDGGPPFAGARLLPLLAPFAVLGAYFAVRGLLFGGLGAKYLDRSYGEWVRDGAAPGHLAASLARLVAPWNDPWAARHGIPGGLRFLWPVLALAPAAVAFVARRRGGDGRAVVGALGFLVASPALTSPMYEVAATLQQGRTLVLPAAALSALLGLLFARAVATPRGRRLATGCGVAAVAWSFLGLWFHLGPFVLASAHAEGVRADFASVPAGARVVLLGAGRGAEPLRGELVAFDGAYVLSGGLPPALAPPFRAEAVIFDPSPPVLFDPASGALVGKDPRTTYVFVAHPPSDEPCPPLQPRFRAFAPPDVAPEADLATLDAAAGRARIRRPPDAPPFARVVLRFASETGRVVEVDVDASDLAPGAEKAADPARLAEAAASLLRSGAPRYLLWAATAEAADRRPLLVQHWRGALPPR